MFIERKSDASLNHQLALTLRDLVDEVDIAGSTALSWAASLGKVEIVKSLLQKGADPSKVDFRGRTPFTLCALDIDCLITLLEAGADVNHQDALGNTKVIRLCVVSSDNTCLLEALHRFKPNLNHLSKDQYTALRLSVERYRPQTTRWLFQNSANINARGPSGQTPLLTAIEGMSPEVPCEFEQLLENTDHTILDIHFESLLHYAARFGSIDIISAVRKANVSGLDVNLRGTRGYDIFEYSNGALTAMDIAEWRRYSNVEWSTMHLKSPDADPKAWFAAFEALIDSIRTSQVAESFGDFWGAIDATEADFTPTTTQRNRSRSWAQQVKNPEGSSDRPLLHAALGIPAKQLAAIIHISWTILQNALGITCKWLKLSRRDMQVLLIFSLGQLILFLGVYYVQKLVS